MSNEMPDSRTMYYDTISGKRYNGRLLRAAGLTLASPGVVVLHNERPSVSNPDFFFVKDSQTCKEVDGKWYIHYVEELLPRDTVAANARRYFDGAIEKMRTGAVDVGDGVSLLATDNTVKVLTALVTNKEVGIGFTPVTGFVVSGTITDKTVEQLNGYIQTIQSHSAKCQAVSELVDVFLEESDAQTIVSTNPVAWAADNY